MLQYDQRIQGEIRLQKKKSPQNVPSEVKENKFEVKKGICMELSDELKHKADSETINITGYYTLTLIPYGES